MKEVFQHSRLDSFACCGSQLQIQEAFDEKGGRDLRLVANYCHDKFCEPCSRSRAQTIQQNVMEHIKDVQRLRFITFTLKHNNNPLVEQLDRLYACFLTLRRQEWWKTNVIGGAAFLEIKRSRNQENWHPHLHVLVEGKFLIQAELMDRWHAITGDSFIVDVRAVQDKGHMAAYVVKYVTKLASHDCVLCKSWLQEIMTATRSRRTCMTFGTWRGLKLSELRDDGRVWTNCGSVALAWRTAKAGDDLAQHRIELLKQRYPLLIEMLDAKDKAQPPPDTCPF